MPCLFKVLISLTIIIISYRILKHLSLALLAGIAVLVLWSGHSLESFWQIAWQRLAEANNLFLLLVVVQVIWLSNQMAQSGNMRALVQVLLNRLSKRTSIALLPALIGLLPMPGGAIFSAPLVADSDPDNSLPPLLKTQINYWFRHIWEYWWPLYPAVLLAMDVTGLPIAIFLIIQIPMSVIAITAGYFFLLRKVSATAAQTKESIHFGQFLHILMPILLVIFTYSFIKIFFPDVAQINKYLPIAIGILLAQLYLQWSRPLTLIFWKGILSQRKTYDLVIIVALVRIYGAFIEARLPGGTLLMDVIRNELSDWNIPIFAMIILIPFISGITTGLGIGFVGASFPIVMNLIGQNPSYTDLATTTVIAYAFGYMGMILSPVHVCLLVTNEYFKTSLYKSIASLIPTAITVLILGYLYYELLHFILGTFLTNMF